MSRVGVVPIEIPKGVTVTVEPAPKGHAVNVKGPRGELRRELDRGIAAVVDGARLKIQREGDTAAMKALHGLWRSLCQGMVQGVSQGFEKRLEVVGVSYQVSIEKGAVRLQVGFSHPVLVPIPAGLKVECPGPTQVLIQGCDKQLVGEFAARLRRVRPPEPYKGKGVRFFGEQISLKPGKSFVSGGG